MSLIKVSDEMLFNSIKNLYLQEEMTATCDLCGNITDYNLEEEFENALNKPCNCGLLLEIKQLREEMQEKEKEIKKLKEYVEIQIKAERSYVEQIEELEEQLNIQP